MDLKPPSGYAYEWSETPRYPSSYDWKRCKGHWSALSEAVSAAATWLGVCQENDYPVCVRILELDTDE